MERIFRAVVSGACGRSAVDLYDNMYRLTELKVPKQKHEGLEHCTALRM